jgi:hypothetical protein
MSLVARDAASGGDALPESASDLKTSACADAGAVCTELPHAASAMAAIVYTSARLKPALALACRAKTASLRDAALAAPVAQSDSVGIQRAPCVVLEEVALECDNRGCSNTTPQERADRCVVPEQPLQLYRVCGVAEEQYVDGVNALTACLNLRASYNPNSLLHVLITPCPKLPTASVALQPGALLRFVACMVNTRLDGSRGNRFSDQLFLGILGRNVLVEAAFNLFLLRDRTDDRYSPCLRRYEAYRDTFPKTVFVDISRCMWAHATLLEDAMTKWLVPEAMGAMCAAQRAEGDCRAPGVEAGVDCHVSGVDAGTATDVPMTSKKLDTATVLAYAKSVSPEWLAAGDADRLCGDLLYHIAFLADELAAASLHPAWDKCVLVPYTRVAALAAAGMRFTPMLFERLLRYSEFFGDCWLSTTTHNFVASLAKAFTGPWALAQENVMSDLAKLLVKRLPRDDAQHLDEAHIHEVDMMLVESSATLQLFTMVTMALGAAAPACPALDMIRAEGAVCAQLCAAIHFVETASRRRCSHGTHAKTRLAFVDAVNRLSAPVNRLSAPVNSDGKCL